MKFEPPPPALHAIDPYTVRVVAPSGDVDEDAMLLATQMHYELKASQYNAEAAHQTAKSRRMGHAPTLTANYTYNDTENSSGDTRIRRPEHLATEDAAGQNLDDNLA